MNGNNLRRQRHLGVSSYQKKIDADQALRKEQYESETSKFYNYISYGVIILCLLSIVGLAVFLNTELLNIKVFVLFALTSLGALLLIILGYKGISVVNEQYADVIIDEEDLSQ